MKRTTFRLRLSAALILCILVFIWGNSLLPGEVSQALSDWVKSVLFTGTSREALGTGSGVLRKVAHFLEFFALGWCLMWRMGMLEKPWSRALFLGAAAAAVDETIQLITPDRGPGIRDVLLDTAGVLTGIILLRMGHSMIQKRSFGGNTK